MVALIVAIGAGACGGTAEPSETVSVSAIQKAMSKAHTFRWESVSGPGRTVGDADTDQRFTTAKSTGGMGLDMALLQRESRTFLRGPGGEWCAFQSDQQEGPLSPFQVIDALRQSGAQLTFVEREDVRGDATAHYRVSGKSDFDIWVDAKDRLRRWRQKIPLGGKAYDTNVEFFDFGTSVTVDQPPATVAECEHV